MTGVIVGKYGKRYLVSREQHFIMLAAPTGTGKGVACVLPNLLNYADSVVVFDLKLENFRMTSAYRERHGQKVFLFAPFARDRRTHRWNMLDAVSRDPLYRIGDILAIGQVLYPGDCDPREKFWNETARNLFLGFVLLLLETPGLPCTMGEVLRQSSGKGRPLKEELNERIALRAAGPAPLSRDCANAFSRFMAAPENTLGNIITTFNAPLLLFANPIVDAATSASDFDLRLLRRQRITLYIGVQPENLGEAAIMVNLLFSQVIGLNTGELPETDPALRYQCLLILDEFTAFGKIGIIAKSSAYIRGYNLRLLTIIQSVAQLESVYGASDARTVMANHGLHILFPPHEQREANDYSERLGYRTVKATSTSVTTPRSWGQSGSTGANVSDQKRALLLPQELKELPADSQIVSLSGIRPILCDKARFYEDRQFIDRLRQISPFLQPIGSHSTPQWKRQLRFARPAFPDEAQLKHAAFVLMELSASVPQLAITTETAAEAIASIHADAGGFDIAMLRNRAAELPAFDDSTVPREDEMERIIAKMIVLTSTRGKCGDCSEQENIAPLATSSTKAPANRIEYAYDEESPDGGATTTASDNH